MMDARSERVAKTLRRVIVDRASTPAEKIAAQEALDRIMNKKPEPKVYATTSRQERPDYSYAKVSWDHGLWRTRTVIRTGQSTENRVFKGIHLNFSEIPEPPCTVAQFNFICGICNSFGWRRPISQNDLTVDEASQWLSHYEPIWRNRHKDYHEY